MIDLVHGAWPHLAPEGSRELWLCLQCVIGALAGGLPAWAALGTGEDRPVDPRGQVFFGASLIAVREHAERHHVQLQHLDYALRVADPHGRVRECCWAGCRQCRRAIAVDGEAQYWSEVVF